MNVVRHRSLRQLITFTAIALCVAAAIPAVAQKARIDVQANVSPEDILYFEGTVTPRRLSPPGRLQVSNEVDVLVEYIEKGGQFRTLPTRVVPTADEAYRGNRLLEGERLEGRDSTLVKISGAKLLEDDEGEPLVVTGTVDLSAAHRFRIISRLRHQWAGSFPEVECSYDVAGPYPVKAGVARERESKDLLSRAGRFLERSVSEIGKGVTQYGGQAASLLLTGSATPLGVLQALLLGEVQQQSGALGEALRFIGGAVGAGASTTAGLEHILTGSAPDSKDLTAALVRGLAARYAGDLTTGGIVGIGPDGDFDVDNLIDGAVEQLEESLAGQLGLRNLRVDLGETGAVLTSQMPNLEGRGHLEPIIAYMLVDAALAAPWTETVSAVFETATGHQIGIAAPAEAARNLARGQIDVETFLQLSRFADPDNPLLTTGGIAGGMPGDTGAASASSQTLLPQAQLPPGWLASGTHTVELADLDEIIPGVELSAGAISWSGMQVLQVNSEPVTMIGLDLGEAGQALGLLQELQSAVGGEQAGSLLRLSTDPPLHGVQSGGRTYLLQGETAPVEKVARLLTSGATGRADAQIGLTALQPSAPAQPVESETESTQAAPTARPAPAPVVPGLPGGPPSATPSVHDETPEPLALERGSYLRKAYLTTVVAGEAPVELEGPLPAGTEQLGAYLEIKDAPRGSILELELIREDFSLGRRMVGVTGDRRTVAYFEPTSGFTPGQYRLEISTDGSLVARLLFEVD